MTQSAKPSARRRTHERSPTDLNDYCYRYTHGRHDVKGEGVSGENRIFCSVCRRWHNIPDNVCLLNLKAECEMLERKVRRLQNKTAATATCEMCKVSYHPRKGSKRRFCGEACSVMSTIKIRTCKFCGESFSRTSRKKGQAPKFCKWACYGAWRQAQKAAGEEFKKIDKSLSDGRYNLTHGSTLPQEKAT